MKTKVIIIAAILTLCSLIFWNCSSGSKSGAVVEDWDDAGRPGGLEIVYPFEGSMFPPEIAPPTIIWKDKSGKAKWWCISIQSGNEEIAWGMTDNKRWKPNPRDWEKVKRKSAGSKAKIFIIGCCCSNDLEPVSGAVCSIGTSSDSVAAPVFYRDVSLPFAYAVLNPHTIKWRLKNIAEDTLGHLVLENLPVCGNCHSFSADGSTIGMDVDYANDKGSYAIAPVSEVTDLNPQSVITWSDFRREDREKTFGLLSQVSPDGRYAVSTVKDVSLFEPKDDLEYSQLFFPLDGILCIYDREKEEFHSLPGADDPEYVQSNAVWSPDGSELLFTRSKAIKSEESGFYKSALLVKEKTDHEKSLAFIESFLEGKRKFKYDLYRIPFNKGLGGEPEPLPGASDDAVSEYFPKYSPDGKWIVFCRAESFMLLQPDSKLYIMPAEGGKPRLMNCNTANMNSWHSWSPNGRWIVFSSKIFGPYTQLFLAHVDENGMDSPPVLIENTTPSERAANIPEFVNIPPEKDFIIKPGFMQKKIYSPTRAHRKMEEGNYAGAITEFNKAIKLYPDQPNLYTGRGIAKKELQNRTGALKDFERAIELGAGNAVPYKEKGLILLEQGKTGQAIKNLNKAVSIDPGNAKNFVLRGYAMLLEKMPRQAIVDFNKAESLKPDRSDLAMIYMQRGLAYYHLNNFERAVRDFSEALRTNPRQAEAYYYRGLALANSGIRGDFCKDFEKALQMGYKQANEAIRQFCK